MVLHEKFASYYYLNNIADEGCIRFRNDDIQFLRN